MAKPKYKSARDAAKNLNNTAHKNTNYFAHPKLNYFVVKKTAIYIRRKGICTTRKMARWDPDTGEIGDFIVPYSD